MSMYLGMRLGHWFARALLKNEIKAYKEALADINKTIELEPEEAEAYQVRAEIEMALGNITSAKEDARKAKELSRNK